jgi:hypothetical protein
MTHVTDEEIREYLVGIVAEDEKEAIQKEKFGEIKGLYVLPYLSLL